MIGSRLIDLTDKLFGYWHVLYRVENGRGVTYRKPYIARISVNNKRIILGYAETFEEAKQLRIQGELKHWGKQITI